jgi:hypothetical protein
MKTISDIAIIFAGPILVVAGVAIVVLAFVSQIGGGSSP